MKVVLLQGSAGAGKTTAIARVASQLFKEKQPFKILIYRKGRYSVDFSYFQKQDLDVASYNKSCISCDIQNLSDYLCELYQKEPTVFVFVEVDESCHKLQEGVVTPLQKSLPEAAIYIFEFQDARSVFDELNRGSYLKVRQELIVMNPNIPQSIRYIFTKKDLLTPFQLERLKYLLAQNYPGKEAVFLNFFLDTDISNWLDFVYGPPTPRFEYQTVAEVLFTQCKEKSSDYEAMIEISGVEANRTVRLLIHRVLRRIMKSELQAQHIKFLVYAGNSVEKISWTLWDPPPQLPRFSNRLVPFKVLMNARYTGEAVLLERIIRTVTEKLDNFMDVAIRSVPVSMETLPFDCKPYNVSKYAKYHLS